MTDDRRQDVDSAALRAAINAAIASQPVAVTSWVLAYEKQIIDDDGDVSIGWGAVISAGSATAIGLCRLVIADTEAENVGGPDD